MFEFPETSWPLRNGKEPMLVIVFLPELISNQVVTLAFSNFGEVAYVFKGRHNFNKNIRNGKEEIQQYYQGKFTAMVVSKEMSFSQKTRTPVETGEGGWWDCSRRPSPKIFVKVDHLLSDNDIEKKNIAKKTKQTN